MNWKFWTWPGQIRSLQISEEHWRKCAQREDKCANDKLTLARRALARSKEKGLTDEEMAEAFTHLLENKGFEAILQLLTSEELAAVDSMVASTASHDEMKHHAGAVSALSNLHARLIELEEQAKEMAKKAA